MSNEFGENDNGQLYFETVGRGQNENNNDQCQIGQTIGKLLGIAANDPFEDEVAAAQAKLNAFDLEAAAEPSFDFYQSVVHERPKLAIGEYISTQGVPVPIMQDLAEWPEAFQKGAAMVRSELSQDYAGLSGLYRSMVFGPEQKYVYPYNFKENFVDSDVDYLRALNYHMRQGLQNLRFSPEDYLREFVWKQQQAQIEQVFAETGLEPFVHMSSGSYWHHIPGHNIKVFGDPHVEGRYYMTATGIKGIKTRDYMVDVKDHSTIIEHSHGGKIPVAQLIEMYDFIRQLPRFDTTQMPVLEMQLDEAGVLHFLQYLKTGRHIQPLSRVVIPALRQRIDDGIMTDNVRGITKPNGEFVRVYISPKRFTSRMRNQGVLLPFAQPNGLREQIMSGMVKIAINEDYISLKGSHNADAPLYRPQIGLGLDVIDNPAMTERIRSVVQFAHGGWGYRAATDLPVYINATVTSNGSTASFVTDWKPRIDHDH